MLGCSAYHATVTMCFAVQETVVLTAWALGSAPRRDCCAIVEPEMKYDRRVTTGWSWLLSKSHGVGPALWFRLDCWGCAGVEKHVGFFFSSATESAAQVRHSFELRALASHQ